jgi:hypothetical protein
MKKCLIYGIVIYLLIMMYINLSLNQQHDQTQLGNNYLMQRPHILYDENGNLKSLNYFKFKLKYGFQSYKELICMPTVAIGSAIFSFILAKQLSE